MQGFFASSTLLKERPDTSLLPKCGACGLFKKCNSPKMETRGSGRKGVLIVGDMPGKEEDEVGRHFVGKAGKLLRDSLFEIGVRLERDVWVTNALICHVPHGKTPDAKQISYCRPNLLSTIATYEPRVVITLGRAALSSVLHEYWDRVGEMQRWTGWQIPLPKYWLCPTYHPSFLIRSKSKLLENLFIEQLEAAFAINRPPPKPIDFPSKVERIYDDAEAAAAIRQFDQIGGWCAFDYEGNCLKPEYPKGRVRCASISNGKRTIAYPWIGKAIKATGEFLRSNRTQKIASNQKYEERWTRKLFGHGVRNWGWDTMLAAHVLDNREGICSLKFQSFVKLGVTAYNSHIEPYLESEGRYNRIEEISMNDLLLYNGIDSLLEHRLARVQRKEMLFED